MITSSHPISFYQHNTGNYEVVLRSFPFPPEKETTESSAMFSEEDGMMYVTAKQFYLSELMSSTRPSGDEEEESDSKGVVRIRIQVGL